MAVPKSGKWVRTGVGADRIRNTPYTSKHRESDNLTHGATHWVPLPGELEKSFNCLSCQKPTRTTEHWCHKPECRKMQGFLLSTNRNFAMTYVEGQSLEWLRRAAFLMKTGNLVTRPDIVGALLLQEAQKYTGQGIPPVAKIPEPKVKVLAPLPIPTFRDPPQEEVTPTPAEPVKVPKAPKKPKVPKVKKVKPPKPEPVEEPTFIDPVPETPIPAEPVSPPPSRQTYEPRPKRTVVRVKEKSVPKITPCIYCHEQRPYTTTTGKLLKYCVFCGRKRYNEDHPYDRLSLNDFVAYTEALFTRKVVDGVYMGGCPNCGKPTELPKFGLTGSQVCDSCIKIMCKIAGSAQSIIRIRLSAARRCSRFNKTHRVVNNR